MIRDFAKLIPKSLSNRSGSVFYSGRSAFDSPSQMYVLGINPGGAPEDHRDETVRSHTRWVLNDAPTNWSAYRDESWEGGIPGTVRMQPRILHLCKRLKLDPGKVPASNLVFPRSVREGKLEGDIDQMARECWPFHKEVIEALGIRVVLCLGQRPGNWVRDRLQASTQVNEFAERNQRRWKSRTYTNTAGMAVVVATHPSIANWKAPATDPTELVQRALLRGAT